MPSSILFITLSGTLYALDTKTGVTAWETTIGNGRSQLCIHQNHAYVVSESQELFVVDTKTGAVIKKVPLSGLGQAPTLLIDHDQVYVTSGGVVHAFQLDGTPLWKNEFKGKGNGSINMATDNADRQADEY